MNKKTPIKFIFFGTPELAVFTLDELKNGDILPSLIITTPDKLAGRGMKLTPPPVKIWAEENFISTFQPETLIENDATETIRKEGSWDLFIVAAYGKIIPKEILGMPKYGTLNIHPSLLPKYRGPSPIESVILSGDNETGVSIILLDEKMDHGDVVVVEKLKLKNENKEELGEELFRMGGRMIVKIMSKFTTQEVIAKKQDHSKATFTKKIKKEDGLIDLSDTAETNWKKFRSYYGWPGIYFFTDNGLRVKITDAEFEKGEFKIKKVIPEGKRETEYNKFLENLS